MQGDFKPSGHGAGGLLACCSIDGLVIQSLDTKLVLTGYLAWWLNTPEVQRVLKDKAGYEYLAVAEEVAGPDIGHSTLGGTGSSGGCADGSRQALSITSGLGSPGASVDFSQVEKSDKKINCGSEYESDAEGSQ
ncbi:MAG: hypothetical protein U0176_16685 [Bacteroidia bacterium]